MSALSARDAAILEFEKKWWHYQGAKQQAIRDAFGLTPTRYYELLEELIDLPEAFALAPATVGRYRRLRDVRDLPRNTRR